MLVERIFPPTSTLYNKWQDSFVKWGEFLDMGGLIQLFTIWTLTVAGIVMQMGSVDRFVYWQWNGWIIGLIKITVVTVLFFTVFQPKELWLAGKKRLTDKELGTHLGLAFVFLLIGWVHIDNPVGHVIKLLPYLAAFLGGLLIFQFVIKQEDGKDERIDINWEQKETILRSSVALFIVAILLGFFFDDPIITSAGIISTPFSLIALLWPSHLRHLQRARFYPLFIFAMFLCVRAPWFLIPLGCLFYTLRTVNYFRYGIVSPSFGVDFLDENE